MVALDTQRAQPLVANVKPIWQMLCIFDVPSSEPYGPQSWEKLCHYDLPDSNIRNGKMRMMLLAIDSTGKFKDVLHSELCSWRYTYTLCLGRSSYISSQDGRRSRALVCYRGVWDERLYFRETTSRNVVPLTSSMRKSNSRIFLFFAPGRNSSQSSFQGLEIVG